MEIKKQQDGGGIRVVGGATWLFQKCIFSIGSNRISFISPMRSIKQRLPRPNKQNLESPRRGLIRKKQAEHERAPGETSG